MICAYKVQWFQFYQRMLLRFHQSVAAFLLLRWHCFFWLYGWYKILNTIPHFDWYFFCITQLLSFVSFSDSEDVKNGYHSSKMRQSLFCRIFASLLLTRYCGLSGLLPEGIIFLTDIKTESPSCGGFSSHRPTYGNLVSHFSEDHSINNGAIWYWSTVL